MKCWSILLSIFLTGILVEASIFSSSLKKLKEKAKSIYKKNFGKDKTWQYTGTDPTEYPGLNHEYRKIQKAKWEKYYECLIVQNKSLDGKISATPEAILGYEGSSVKLICKICLSPIDQERGNTIVWEWAAEGQKHMEQVDLNDNILISPHDKTLMLYNLQKDQTGQYKCKLGETLTLPYFLTVGEIIEDNFIKVHTSKSPNHPHKQRPLVIREYSLILDTEWGDWSGCTICGEVGKKHKIGYCTVGINTEKSYNLYNESAKQLPEKDLELLKTFKFGMPCASYILPDSVKQIPQVAERKNEIMTGFCKIECPKAVLFEVKDKNGNIIEVANNSAGVYSMFQGDPPIEPEVQRRLQYGVKGKLVEITCPGSMNNDAPIQWQIGGLNVIPELIEQESKGRMFVSISDRIHIKKALIHDSKYYSCWQDSELAGVVQLVVEKRIELNFNHHIMLFGIIIILSTFILIFLRVFLGRKHSKLGQDPLLAKNDLTNS